MEEAILRASGVRPRQAESTSVAVPARKRAKVDGRPAASVRGISCPEIHHDLDAPISPITNRLTDQIPPLSIHAVEISETARNPVTKSRPYSVTRSREDPSLHNAKPRELDALFLQQPSDATTDNVGAPIDEMALLSNRIFSDVSFSSLKLDPRLAEVLEGQRVDANIVSCTTVQSMVLPIMIERRQNMLIKSQTGSGKTIAYLLPILHDLMSLRPQISRSDGCRALVIAPTRELCTQIGEVLHKLTQCCVWIVGGCITGGERRKSEKSRLRKGVSVLVGTPGRLLDHLNTTEAFHLTGLRWVVLDEVDRLLDMGFEQTIMQILTVIRGERIVGLKDKHADGPKTASSKGSAVNLHRTWQLQNTARAKKCNSGDLVMMMCSATLTTAVKQLALPLLGSSSSSAIGGGGGGFLVVDADAKSLDRINSEKQLMQLGMGSSVLVDGSSCRDDDAMGAAKASSLLAKGEVVCAPSQLSQFFMMTTCKWRLTALLSFLRTHCHQKLVVFLSTCDSVDYMSLLLREVEWPTELDDPIRDKDGNIVDADGLGPAQSSSSAGVRHFVEPLDCSFSGMFGSDRPIYRLHGNIPQQVRKAVHQQFSAADHGILLCTDVAARGLDLPGVHWILQFDPPCETADYVHRIGRTARKGREGCALLFLLPSEASYIPLLATHGLLPQPLSLQSLFVSAAKHIPGAAKFKNTDEMSAVILQRRVERVVLSNKWLHGAGVQAFRSYIRAYATHSTETKAIFNVQSLHLGHVAKSFGLQDNPKNLRNCDDVIGKIFNGEYSAFNVKNQDSRESKQNTRNHRSRGDAGGQQSVVGYDKGSVALTTTRPGALKTGSDKQKLRKMGKRSATSGSSSRMLSSSGKFRKTNGYFKKQLRSQTSAEFGN